MDTGTKRRKLITKSYSLEEAIEVLKENNVELLKEIIENQPEIVSKRDQNENCLLHYATLGGNEEIVDLLINKGSDIETRNCFGATPLQIATLKTNLDLIKLLIEKGVSIEVFDTNGNLLFDNSSEKGREVIKYLLDNRISVISPISFTSENSSSKSRILLSKGIFSEIACKRVKEEWEKGVESEKMEIEIISEKEKEELFEAVEEGDIELVKKMIIMLLGKMT